MKLNFCTLFNSAYLSRGLVMYKSLLECCDSFHLYVFAFDDVAFHFIKKQNYPNLTVISLKEFEDADLLKIKPTRTTGEYCWTCTPSTILYCLEIFKLDHCTYIDADLLFYENPEVLIDEMKDDSVLITEHRYTPLYDQSETSGIYCVQFITFKNDDRGLKVLSWWRNACIEWCFARAENGKFGDQKYLDNWTKQFEGVHVLQHLGGGIAPWNVQQYSFRINNNQIEGEERATGKKFHAVFYHFHDLKFYVNDRVELTGGLYFLPGDAVSVFYKPYLKKWKKTREEINIISGNSFDAHGINKHFLPSSLILTFQDFLYNTKSFLKAILSGKTEFVKRYNHFRNLKSF